MLNIPHTRRDHRIDWQGALALTVGLVPLLIVAEQGRGWGWARRRAIACYLVGVLGIVSFVWAESRAGDEALIPLRLFGNRTFSLTSVVGTDRRHGHVRRHRVAAAVPADRQGPDRRRLRA